MNVRIYKPHGTLEGKVDESRCRASVHDGGRGCGFHQCSRKTVVVVDGYGFCKQHSPEAQKARDRECEERYQKEREATERRYAQNEARSELLRLVVVLRDANWILNDEIKRRMKDALERSGVE